MTATLLPFDPATKVAIPSGGTDTLAADLGKVYWDGDKAYRLCKAGGTIAAASPVVTALGTAVPSWIVATTGTANNHLVAGIVNVACVLNDYVLVQCAGQTDMTSAAAIADGGLVGTSTTAGKGDDATVAAGVGAMGVALEAAAGADEATSVLLKGLL